MPSKASYITIEDSYSRHLSVEAKIAMQQEAVTQRSRKLSNISLLNTPNREPSVFDSTDARRAGERTRRVHYEMEERIDQITDMPIPVVNKVLYWDSEDDD